MSDILKHMKSLTVEDIMKLREEILQDDKLIPCPTCGYKTTRDFCTPECRRIDSDNRIEFVEEERDKLQAENEALRELVYKCRGLLYARNSGEAHRIWGDVEDKLYDLLGN